MHASPGLKSFSIFSTAFLTYQAADQAQAAGHGYGVSSYHKPVDLVFVYLSCDRWPGGKLVEEVRPGASSRNLSAGGSVERDLCCDSMHTAHVFNTFLVKSGGCSLYHL
jgi:hypothetical protein